MLTSVRTAVSILWRPTGWVLSPLTVLLQFLGRVLSLVFYSPLLILARVETLYTYCGSAAIIGALVGSLVALLSYNLASALGFLDTSSYLALAPEDSIGKRHPKLPNEPKLHQPPKPSGFRLRPSFPPPIPTILEEEEEEDSPLLHRLKGRKGRYALFERKSRAEKDPYDS